jgi:hypothetical protein
MTDRKTIAETTIETDSSGRWMIKGILWGNA